MKFKSQLGFTMIETLVSLLIISVGILGFALLQVESLKAAKTATERSRAVHFATDMMDRIRANKASVTDYAVTIDGPGTIPSTVCADPAATPALTIGSPNACTGAEMAAYEIWQWRTAVQDAIYGLGNDNGEAGITVTGTDPWTVTLTIQWSERDEDLNYILSSVIH